MPTSPPMKLKVAAAHIAPVFLDVAATVQKACTWIEKAGKEGIDLVVFPEVFIPGFPYWINCYPPLAQGEMNRRYMRASIQVPGPEVEQLAAAAGRAGVAVVMGASERDHMTCYNTQIFIDKDGRYLGKHRKLQPTYAERFIWGQGDGSTLRVWDTAVGRLGGLACWEHTMNLARQALILQHIQIHAASWPALSTLVGFDQMFDQQVDAMCRNHAITGQCFVIVAEETVTDDAIRIIEEALGPQQMMSAGGGWSTIIGPWGVHLVEPHTGPEERLVAVDIDLGDIEIVKGVVDNAGHYSRPEILHLELNTTPQRNLHLSAPFRDAVEASARETRAEAEDAPVTRLQAGE